MNYALRDIWFTRLLTTRSLVWIWHQSKVTSSASFNSCSVICINWPITDSNDFSDQGLSTCPFRHRNTISGTRANEYGMFMWDSFFTITVFTVGRDVFIHSYLLIPFSSHLNILWFFLERRSHLNIGFPLGINHFFLAALFFKFWKMRVSLSQTLPDQGNWIQIFTSEKQSHSTSYCLHDYESSGMSFVNKVLCLDCWLCLCGCRVCS